MKFDSYGNIIKHHYPHMSPSNESQPHFLPRCEVGWNEPIFQYLQSKNTRGLVFLYVVFRREEVFLYWNQDTLFFIETRLDWTCGSYLIK